MVAVSRKSRDKAQDDNDALLAEARKHGWFVEPDPAVRAAAAAEFMRLLNNLPQPGEGACAPGDYGKRDDWYDRD